MSDKALTLEEWKKNFILFGGVLNTVAIRKLPNGREYGYALGAFLAKAWQAAQAPLLAKLAAKDEEIEMLKKQLNHGYKLEEIKKRFTIDKMSFEDGDRDFIVYKPYLDGNDHSTSARWITFEEAIDICCNDSIAGITWRADALKLKLAEVEKKYGRAVAINGENFCHGATCYLIYHKFIQSPNIKTPTIGDCFKCWDKCFSNDALFKEDGSLR